jgi:hypothetical protein
MTIIHRVFVVTVLALGIPSAATATVYHGFPHLHLTMAVVNAGGGARNFKSERLVEKIAGSNENAKLIRRFGTARVNTFYDVFTFAVNDAVKTAHNMVIPLPKKADPDPSDRVALANALYNAGVTPNHKFDVGYMLEVLMSHQIHHNIMGDMDRKFTPALNADFHLILTNVMQDAKRKSDLAQR